MRRAAVVLLCLSVWSCARREEAGSGRQVRIAVGGQAQLVYLPATLAAQLGHYKAEGLDVALSDFAGGAKALESLIGGSTDVVCGFYDHTIQMQAEGRALKAFVVMQRFPGLALVVSPATKRPIERIADLRGGIVGVSSPGSSTSLLFRYLLSREKVDPGQVSEAGIGMSGTAIAAMQHGKVDAAVMADPAITVLERRFGKLKILVDTRTQEGVRAAFGVDEYPAAVLYSTAAWVGQHRETREALARAIRKTLSWMQQHSAEEIAAAMPATFRGDDPALYAETIRKALPMYSTDGRMPASGPEAVERVLRVSLEKVRLAKLDLQATFIPDGGSN